MIHRKIQQKMRNRTVLKWTTLSNVILRYCLFQTWLSKTLHYKMKDGIYVNVSRVMRGVGHIFK